MTAPAPVLERSTSPVRAATSRLPVSYTEWGVAFLVTFLLNYNTPYVWWKQIASLDPNNVDRNLGNGQLMPIFAAALAFMLLNLRCDIAPFIRAALREPLLIVLLALAVASAGWSVIPEITLRESLNLVLVSIFGYWIAMRFTLTEYLGVLTAMFAVGTVLNAVFIEFLGEKGSSGPGWDGILYNRNVFGANCALAICVLLISARVFRRFRVLLYALTILNVVLVLGSKSSTSLLLMVLIPAFTLVCALFRAKRTLYAVVSIMIGMMSALLTLVAVGQLAFIAEAVDRNPNLTGRVDIWSAVTPVIKMHPWLGWGWAGVWWDWTTPGALINKNFPWAPAAHSHNGLLEAMLQLGVIGGVLVIAIHVRLIVRAARIVRYYRGAVGLFPLTYAAYVLMSSITEPGIYYRRAPFLIYVVLLTVAARGRRDVLPLEPPAVESRGLRRS